MGQDKIELGKLEISGTPERVETWVSKSGHGCIRFVFPDAAPIDVKVLTIPMDLEQASGLYVNLGKLIAMLQVQTVRKQ